MSLYLLQFDFPYNGPWAREMLKAFEAQALSIAKEPGLRWKLWTENESSQEAGGIYLFNDAESALKYARLHTDRLRAAGVSNLNCKFLQVSDTLSRINLAPLDDTPFKANEIPPESLYLVQTDFSHQGPWGEEMAEAYRPLAEQFTQEPGLLWKVWTENPGTHVAGGLFVFGDAKNAERFIEEHKVRLKEGGFKDSSCKLFAINGELTRLSLP